MVDRKKELGMYIEKVMDDLDEILRETTLILKDLEVSITELKSEEGDE